MNQECEFWYGLSTRSGAHFGSRTENRVSSRKHKAAKPPLDKREKDHTSCISGQAPDAVGGRLDSEKKRRKEERVSESAEIELML